MPIILERYPIPDSGPLKITVDISAEIKVTAEEARRMVNRWLIEHVSILMGADKPTLAVGEKVVWRVPVHISYPHVGEAGIVGQVNVDVETGAMDNTSEKIAEMYECAKKIHARLPPYEPKRETPAEYLAKDVPPARKLVIAADGMVRLAPEEKAE